MTMLGTRLVSTFDAGDGVRLSCSWCGGPDVYVIAMGRHGLRTLARWDIWNYAWQSPLVRHDAQAFEQYCRLRLSEPGAVAELLEQLPA